MTVIFTPREANKEGKKPQIKQVNVTGIETRRVADVTAVRLRVCRQDGSTLALKWRNLDKYNMEVTSE